MGRSLSFCFSIRACAGEDDDGGISKLPEIKASPEKRKWSLRKKNAKQHAQSSTVILETLPPFSVNKQNHETIDSTSYSENISSDQGGASIIESPMLQSPYTTLVDSRISEQVIVMQKSIRQYLAQNEFYKLKNVVKLQAAARGYLVRRQAAGTLRCIQAIIKMQILVRARLSTQSIEPVEKASHKECSQADVVPQYDDMPPNQKPSEIRNLISSAFARQLLESTPKSKPIHINCDPLRPDSAWKWLDRWMALKSNGQHKFIPQNATKSLEIPEVVDQILLFTPVQNKELQSTVQKAFVIENNEDLSNIGAKVVSTDNSSQRKQLSDYTEDGINGSPRSRIFASDFSSAPSNLASLRVRNSKSNVSIPATERKPHKIVKNSPKHTKNDLYIGKDTKNARRPNSSGTDHENRNSIDSVPSYMQPTESVKARANTSFSHIATVGLHHSDNPIKKRHSLPIGSEKQGLSPQTQITPRKSHEFLGNGVSPYNSAERRWQI